MSGLCGDLLLQLNVTELVVSAFLPENSLLVSIIEEVHQPPWEQVPYYQPRQAKPVR
jgi:hypothetical protein